MRVSPKEGLAGEEHSTLLLHSTLTSESLSLVPKSLINSRFWFSSLNFDASYAKRNDAQTKEQQFLRKYYFPTSHS